MFKQFAFLLLSLFVTSTAVAQQQSVPTTNVTRTAMKDWSLECLDAAVDGLKCQAIYTVLFGDDRAPVFVAAIAGRPGQPAQVTMALPLNIQLRQGLTIAGENGASVTFPFDRCNPNGCFVERPFTTDLYAIMNGNASGTASVTRNGGDEFKIPFSFNGFRDALTAMSQQNAASSGAGN